jgi:uncharacterized protein (DUF433 family)
MSKQMISIHPDIRFGKPRLDGTRIAVADVMQLVNAGVSIREIIGEYYPDLNEEQVKACIEYANRSNTGK